MSPKALSTATAFTELHPTHCCIPDYMDEKVNKKSAGDQAAQAPLDPSNSRVALHRNGEIEGLRCKAYSTDRPHLETFEELDGNLQAHHILVGLSRRDGSRTKQQVAVLPASRMQVLWLAPRSQSCLRSDISGSNTLDDRLEDLQAPCLPA